jgi:hypothetical protein
VPVFAQQQQPGELHHPGEDGNVDAFTAAAAADVMTGGGSSAGGSEHSAISEDNAAADGALASTSAVEGVNHPNLLAPSLPPRSPFQSAIRGAKRAGLYARLGAEDSQRLIDAFKAAAEPAASQEVWEDAVEDEEGFDATSDDEEILDGIAAGAAAVPAPAAAPAEAQDDVWPKVRWCVNLCTCM